MYKANIEKLKQRLEQNKETAQNNKFKKTTIEENPILKVSGAGTYDFRAVPYVHNKDVEAEPFFVGHYHFGMPGNKVFYCPEKNGDTGRGSCPICKFVWDQMKSNKGNSVEVGNWKKFLPQMRVAVPGLLRGREKEGIKFLLLTTFEDKLGKHHQKIVNYLLKPATSNFMDLESGFDLELTYEEYTDGRAKQFGGFGFSGLELARDRTPVTEDPQAFWNSLKDEMKLFTEVPGYQKRTVEDAHEALKKWLEIQQKLVSKSNEKSGNKEVEDADDGEIVENNDEASLTAHREEESRKAKEKAESTASTAAKAKAMLAEKMKSMGVKSA